jgi:hypothetical protein
MLVWISPPAPAGGDPSRIFDGYAVPDGTRTGRRRHGARAEELNNLRLALATFALQLDSFEMRAGEALKAAIRHEMAVPARDAGCKLQKEK